MRKQIAFGFLTGLVLTFCILSVSNTFVDAAQSRLAQTVNYPIYIDNVLWSPQTPALNVEGSTYLPLRAMSEALGVQIDWSKDFRRVDVYKNKKPGDFSIGDPDKMLNGGTTPSSTAAQGVTTNTLYNFVTTNYNSNPGAFGCETAFCQDSNGGMELIYAKDFNSSSGEFTKQIRFNLKDRIYKSIDSKKVATWVTFDTNMNVLEVSIAASVVKDQTDERYTNAVNAFKKDIDLLQNTVLKNTKKADIFGKTIEEMKKVNY